MSLEYFALKLRVSHVSKTLLILACSIPPFLLFKCQRELPLHPLSLPLSFSLLCSHFHFHCTMLFISYLGQTLLIFACSLPPLSPIQMPARVPSPTNIWQANHHFHFFVCSHFHFHRTMLFISYLGQDARLLTSGLRYAKNVLSKKKSGTCFSKVFLVENPPSYFHYYVSLLCQLVEENHTNLIKANKCLAGLH